MALTTDNPVLEEAFRELAAITGEPEETSVYQAVQEKLVRTRGNSRQVDWDAIRAIQSRVAKLPVLDRRSDDEILGYNEQGLFD